MWWISLLTLYQLLVNNYYSRSIVAESIPGCCHLAWGKRLAWELLFCIWSNVIHFIIQCNTRKTASLEWWNELTMFWSSFLREIQYLFFWNWMNQMGFSTELQTCCEITAVRSVSVKYPITLWDTHTGLHPAPLHMSVIVYSEYNVASTFSPCGLDQSVAIMLIWAVSHWEKKKKMGVKLVCVHVVCDYMQ